jgi:pSer/pThr/pTyr-binding forkhead associated (FHA) protein
MIKCTECGYENMDGLDYCDGCGAKLNPAAGAGTTAGASASATPAGEPQPVQTSGAATEVPASGPVEAPKPSEAPTGEIKPQAQGPEHTATEATQTSAPAAEPSTTTEPAPAAAAPAAAVPSAGAAALKAKFVLVRGGRKGQEFPLEEGNNLVGRWDPETGSFPEVDLEQDDPEAKISRKHALLRIESDKITVEDIGSLNGTYVNRSPRLQPGNPVELKNGDEIIIGKTFLKLVVEHLS